MERPNTKEGDWVGNPEDLRDVLLALAGRGSDIRSCRVVSLDVRRGRSRADPANHGNRDPLVQVEPHPVRPFWLSGVAVHICHPQPARKPARM